MNRALFALAALLPSLVFATDNLLLNPDFQFTALGPLRSGKSVTRQAGSVPFWESNGYDQVKAMRSPAITEFRPTLPVDAAICLEPGATLSQWVLLSEAGIDPGDLLSLAVNGFQPEGSALTVRLNAMMTDAEEGEWSPQEYGQTDKRTFRKMARGEAVPLKLGELTPQAGTFTVKQEGIKVPGGDGSPTQPLAVELLFTNHGTAAGWIYAPRLVKGDRAPAGRVSGPALPEYYRSIPRTITKLHAGEPLHIVLMGSSNDRGSANPPLYRYDEDPTSPTYKQPLSKGNRLFDGEEIGRPELTPYYGWWAHYYSYAGRLRLWLMNRFDLPAEKLLINFMAADGSSIGEAHSGLRSWATLSVPPAPAVNGHQEGKEWEALYPGLFTRPEGPRPDLVIFGSGANEKIDGPDEVAVYEGTIRWFQRRYPGVEFVVALWNNRERYTPGAVMMRQLALRYGFPVIEVGREIHLLTRHADVSHLTQVDGHPQAIAHDLWGRLLERAFQAADPMKPGLPQTRLPERLSPYTLNWEGEMTSFSADSPRFYRNRAFIVEDAAFNLWATDNGAKLKKLAFKINGLPSTDRSFANGSRLRPMGARDERNSTLAVGRLALGERHLVELITPEAGLVAVDMKTALHRRWQPVSSALWEGKPAEPTSFDSKWGAPYGTEQLQLQPGQKARLRWVGTLASVAWLQQEGGGTLIASVTGQTALLKRPTGEATKLADESAHFMEDRGALSLLPYGVHELEVTAKDGPVALLGAFTYDTRPNRDAERSESGIAAPGEKITFGEPFKATPLVHCEGGLTVEKVTPEAVTFGGSGAGSYRITGE